MGKNASKNFVNQFKNTRRQAGLASRRPLAGQVRNLKKPLPGERKNEKNTSPTKLDK